MNETTKCPICHKGEKLPNNEQPDSGTHAYTIVYNCGTEIDYAISDSKAEHGSYSQRCDEPRKQSVTEMITDMKANKEKRKWEAIKFEGWDTPQSEIHLYYEILSYMKKALEEAPIGEKGTTVIHAPELLTSVLKQGKGHLNPSIVIQLIKKLDKGLVL